MSQNKRNCNPPKSTTTKKLPFFNCSSSKDEPQYNIVYEKLVKDENDIVGQLAYCLYKQSKQKYVQEFSRLNCRPPSNEELANHVSCSEIPTLTMYQTKAAQVVTELLRQAAAEKEDELEKHFRDRLWQFIDRHQPEGFLERSWHKITGLFYGGVGGVLGNLFTTIIIILFLFGAASSTTRDGFYSSAKENLVSGLAQVIGVPIAINKESSPAIQQPQHEP